MRTQRALFLAAVVAAAIGAAEGAGEEAVSPGVAFTIDSRSSPRAVKSQAELSSLMDATRRVGESVTLTSPGGTATTLAAADSGSSGVEFKSQLDAGGLWTLENSRQGAASFTVRHSIYGTLGDGSAASPARIVDEDELIDYNAPAGYVFVLEGADALFGALRLPSGVQLEKADGGGWRIVSSADGREYAWGDVAWTVDSVGDGPNRRVIRGHEPPVAYSGDDWTGDAAKASTLTFVSPQGETTTIQRTGTGAVVFTFNRTGTWAVSLTMADGTTRHAEIDVRGTFVIVIR